MKIGLLTSYRGQKKFEKEHKAIVAHLEKKGHEVVHNMQVTIDHLQPLGYAEREKIFVTFHEALEECELIFAECSLQSTQVGFGLAHVRAKGKPIVILALKGSETEYPSKGKVFSQVENMMVYEYDPDTIGKVIDEALIYMDPHIEKRFTMIFPSALLAQVEQEAKKKKVPKAVYIRQLLEKNLKKSSEK